MAWIGGLLVISIAVAGVIIASTLPSIGSPRRGQLFVRCCTIAGIAAVGSTLMYTIYETTVTVPALVIGDTFMVLGPGGILLALRSLSGRLRGAVIVVSCTVLVVAATTTLIGLPVSALVKVSALLLLCVLTARETRVAPIVGEAVAPGVQPGAVCGTRVARVVRERDRDGGHRPRRADGWLTSRHRERHVPGRHRQSMTPISRWCDLARLPGCITEAG